MTLYFFNWREMIKITKRDNEYMEDGYSYINSMEMVNKGVDMLFELIRTGVGGMTFQEITFLERYLNLLDC